jgi:3-phenylpropionate/trans-cinnamate dioxygenase ferredoxin reductase component
MVRATRARLELTMADRKTFLIVGAGLAGAKAAEGLRANGFDGRITLVGADLELPYERPPLSKSYLTGESPREAAQVHAERFYDDNEIELLTATVALGLDVGAHRVELSDLDTLAYDRLLIATGALPRRPRIPGASLDGVHVLRTLHDADALRHDLGGGGALVVIGAGWIGCEVAAGARKLGNDVTLVESAQTPLERVLGPTLGGFYADVHRKQGVRVITRAGVEAIEGDGRVRRVRLAGGEHVDCDTVVLGVGVAPDTGFAASGGLEIGDGIVVDEHLRSSAPDVFAAGDVAAALHPRYGRHVRVEHWANALSQGTFAGASMLDHPEPYDRLPYFFSDQYDVGMEYVGLHDPADHLVIRGRLADERFQAFWLGPDGRVTAGLHVNDWDSIDSIRQLVETAPVVDSARLADVDAPLAAAPSSAS